MKRLSKSEIDSRLNDIFSGNIKLVSEYKNSKEYNSFHCSLHNHIFKHKLDKVLKIKKPCPLCNSKINLSYIDELKNIHNNEYEYNLDDLKNGSRKIGIICKTHGEFKQDFYTHLNGSKCPKCRGYNKSTLYFIEECSKVHNNEYDYSNVEYTGSHSKINVLCKVHGSFEVKANNHLNGQKCYKCSIGLKSLDEYKRDLNIIFDYKYNYDDILCVNLKSDYINVKCYNHGSFKIKLSHHLSGIGCKKCSDDSKRLDNNIFTKRSIEVHGNLYDYSFVDYKSIKDRVDIICKKHGIFSQIASDHLRGSGCPKCNTSKGERYIIDYLLNNNINFLYQYKFEKCKNKKILIYDFFIPELNICIEFDGIQHYIPIDFFGGVDGFESLKINDDIKNNFCIENGIELYRIPYWSIGDINNIMDLIFFG